MTPVVDPERPDPPDPLARLADVVVFAPIGLAAVARERLPELAADGRQRVEQRITVARFIGRMVVEQGRRELERRLHAAITPRVAPAPAVDDPSPAGVADDPADVAPADDEIIAPRRSVPTRSAAPVADLPIDDYESLAASQVVARLGDLDPAGLAAVEAFERAHRNRRTVLGRIGQLRSDP